MEHQNKIKYGIHISDDSASIAKMEAESPMIMRSDVQKDKIPLCVSFNKKGAILTGDAAFRAYRKEIAKNFNGFHSINSFFGFRNTLGTDVKYFSPNASKEFKSEELIAEVLKKLKSFVQKKEIKAAVITIPAAYKMNQVFAMRQAAILAGIEHAELLSEPIAAQLAYTYNRIIKDGCFIIFYYGSGTFNVSLLKLENGVPKVIDTEGNNYLGGKNLDYALVDEIIIPNIQENFTINNLLQDDEKRNRCRTALKFHAEELKNQLSFKDEVNLYFDPGDAGEDDDGEEIEIDITLTRDMLREVVAPVYQKAIDATKTLLNRNNIEETNLNSIFLAGTNTLSPILREMLSEQIKAPDTSLDPSNVLVKGAAIYASTIDLPYYIKEKTWNRNKIQLDVTYESTSIENEEYISIKTLPEKIEGNIPEKIFVELQRKDGAWLSAKKEINEIGDVIEVSLAKSNNNTFQIILTDKRGNRLESEPDMISILQGYKTDSATLPYNIGIEIEDKETGKIVFKTIKGLEKNKSLPATGHIKGFKNEKPLRPGNKSDFIKIPIYQGEHGADGTRAIYNEHVYDIIISGDDLPYLLPENTDIDITIVVDRSQNMTMKAYFAFLDYTSEVELPSFHTETINAYWLKNEIKKAKSALKDLKENSNVDETKISLLDERINELEKQFNKNKEDIDTKQEVLSNLRRCLKEIDKEKEGQEWPLLEKQLKEAFYKLEKANEEKGNDQTNELVDKYKNDVENLIQTQDKKLAPQLTEDINLLASKMQRSSTETVITIQDVEPLKNKLIESLSESLIDQKKFTRMFDLLYDISEQNIQQYQDELVAIEKEIQGYEK